MFVFGNPVHIVRQNPDGSYELGGIEYLKENLEEHIPMVGDRLTYFEEDFSYVLEIIERHLVDDTRYAKRSWCLIARQVDKSAVVDRLTVCLRSISDLHAKAVQAHNVEIQKYVAEEILEPAEKRALDRSAKS